MFAAACRLAAALAIAVVQPNRGDIAPNFYPAAIGPKAIPSILIATPLHILMLVKIPTRKSLFAPEGSQWDQGMGTEDGPQLPPGLECRGWRSSYSWVIVRLCH
jgi:hypothetical protein